jgi:hypothetical protein
MKTGQAEGHKAWKVENAQAVTEYNRAWYAENGINYHKKWRGENREKVNLAGRKNQGKKRSTVKGKLNDNLSRAVRQSLRSGTKARCRWEDLVGYTVDQLKAHLEKLFTLEMSWENYGTFWEIDHRIPIAAHNFESPNDPDFKKCWALKNLRPLEIIKNRSKHDKVERPFQPSLTIGG